MGRDESVGIFLQIYEPLIQLMEEGIVFTFREGGYIIKIGQKSCEWLIKMLWKLKKIEENLYFVVECKSR